MKQTATLEKVREAYLELERSGGKVSVRKIVELTGGSHSTVTPLMRQFEEQRRQERELNITMSESFRQAYINDIYAAGQKARDDVEHALGSIRENEQDLLAELSTAENRIHVLESQIKEDQTRAEEKTQDADHRITALQQKTIDVEQERDAHCEEKAQLQQQVTELRSELSRNTLLLSQSQENTQTLKQENDALLHKITEHQAQIVDLGKRSEIATGRWEDIQGQLAEIKAELKETRQQLETERDRRTEAEKHVARLEG